MSSSTKAWSSLDRKATAVAEFTLRQYRTRLSTWVVLVSCLVALSTVLLFYIDFMNDPIASVDNDGDGLFDEDGPDFPAVSDATSTTMGTDDDGDCLQADRPDGAKDTNGNGVVCDAILRKDWFGSTTILWDNGVDEDPDDEAFIQEATHRAFLLGYGKLGVVFLLGIFLPLFLATGLIRGEMTSETMHFLLAKPIARGEVLLYRMLGYLTLVWPASAIVVLLSAVVTGLAAPGDGFFRFEDLGIWLSILLATWLALLVYGMLFMSLGVMWKYGIVLAIPFAAWEFGMAFLSMGLPSSPLLRVSVIGWCLSIIDAATALSWTDQDAFIAYTTDYSIWSNQLVAPGEPLAFLASAAPFDMSPTANMAVAVLVLLFQASVIWVVGQSLFKGKEIA